MHTGRVQPSAEGGDGQRQLGDVHMVGFYRVVL